MLQIANRYNAVPKKPKEEDTESKSETNSGYKDMMFSNTNRILIGEGYQAGMPEFLLNKPLSKKIFLYHKFILNFFFFLIRNARIQE